MLLFGKRYTMTKINFGHTISTINISNNDLVSIFFILANISLASKRLSALM